MDKKNTNFSLVELIVVIFVIFVMAVMTSVLSPSLRAAYINSQEDTQNTPTIEQPAPEDEHIIQIPEGYKFVQWATEGKSYIIEDENGVQTIVIIKFD